MDSKLLKHFKWIPVAEIERPKAGLNRTYVDYYWITREVNGIPCVAVYVKNSMTAQCNANGAIGERLYAKELEAGIFTMTQIPVGSIPWDDYWGIFPAWFERHALTDHSHLDNHLTESEVAMPTILSEGH